MPVEFVRQDVCENGKCASTRLTLDYDGTGRRISKTVWRKAAGESGWTKDNVTHYTGIGTEVRENFAGSTPGAKVVVSLPEGLGRYAPGDASEAQTATAQLDENGKPVSWGSVAQNFEWYLKNHLGSTMLVFGTQSTASPDVADNGTLKAAYDYHAFGEQLTLAEPTDKVTENFTGKGIRGERCDSRVYSSWHCRAEEHCAQRNERDDEIELNYFGARYLDPMLGLWTSVDPARLFSSPYLYAGNGMNLLMGVDGDGNEFVDGMVGLYKQSTGYCKTVFDRYHGYKMKFGGAIADFGKQGDAGTALKVTQQMKKEYSYDNEVQNADYLLGINSNLPIERQIATLVHEAVEAGGMAKRAYWHVPNPDRTNPKLEKIFEYYKDKGGYDAFLKANFDGNLQDLDGNKYESDEIYREEYKCFIDIK